MKAVILLACLSLSSSERQSHIDISAALHKGQEKPKFDILAILHGHHKKKRAADPTAFLGKIMESTQRGLAMAEKHHDAAVKVARDQIDSLLTKQSSKLAAAMQTYNASLVGAIAALQATRDVSKQALDKAEKAESSSSWDASAGQELAQLSAKVGSVDSELRKATRQTASSMRMITSRADMLISEGDVQTLSRKLGDISDLVQKAHDNMLAVPNVSVAVKPAFTQKSAVAISLKQASGALASALKLAAASKASAEKELNAVLDAVEKEQTARAKTIDDGLVVAEKVELAKVKGAAGGMQIPKIPKVSKKELPKKTMI